MKRAIQRDASSLVIMGLIIEIVAMAMLQWAPSNIRVENYTLIALAFAGATMALVGGLIMVKQHIQEDRNETY